MVYDPDSAELDILRPPSFNVARRVHMEAPVTEVVALSDSSVATYYPANGHGAFSLYDPEGHLVTQTVPIHDQNLRIFHGRTQNGGIAEDPNGGIVGILPDRFALMRFSPQLRLTQRYRGGQDSAWAPDARPFPDGLNPYDYSPLHQKWWDSFLHIGRPFVLGQNVILVSLYDSHGMGIQAEYVNLYSEDGRILAEGVRVPHNGHVVGGGRGVLYVATEPHIVGDSTVVALQVYKYSLVSGFVTGGDEPSRPALAGKR